MPDRQHPDHTDRPDLRSAIPNGTSGVSLDDPFEQLLRVQLRELADHAPTTVRSLDEVRIEHAGRIGVRRTSRREGRHRRSAGIGATIAALAGAIGITTVALSGAGTAGAASPEEAVRNFLDAAQAEDVFGMIDAMDPFEVPAARAAVERGRADAVEADIVSEGFQLDGVDGVDLEFADLGFATEPVLDGVSVVQVTGAVSFDFDPSAFPLGEALADAIAPDLQPITESRDLTAVVQPAMLATIERDGRWYVSGSFTIGEYARRAADLPMPAQPLAAGGAATPEAAADQFWASMLDLDAASMLALAAPGEGDALLAYGPLILDAWNESVSDLRSDQFVLTLDRTTPDVSGSGDRRRVEATTFTVRGTVPAQELYGFYDPALPTVISTWEGDGIVVLDPGVPIPETLEGYEIDTEFGYPDGASNFTMENDDGTVQPLPEMPAPTAPSAITIERSEGCTTYSGQGAINLLGASSMTTQADGTVVTETVGPSGWGIEQVGDESWRTCTPPKGLSAVWSLFGFGGLTELPALQVVEVDGRWFVSPIGTAGEAVLGLFDAGENGSLLDTPFASVLLGIDRGTLEVMFSGGRLADLTDECQPLAVADADGIITGLTEDIDLGQARACSDGPIYRDGRFPFEEMDAAPSPLGATAVEESITPGDGSASDVAP
jgi:hypothetical protein